MKKNYFVQSVGLRWVLIVLFLLLSGCGNQYEKQVGQEYLRVEKNLQSLRKKLDNKQLSHIKIVEVYAKKLAQLKPDFKPVAEAMVIDASANGALFQGLEQRLKQVNREPENEQQFQTAMQSLISIDTGVNPLVFNEALIDLINTLAELSGGKLATMSIPKQTQSSNVRAESVVPGSYLIGNPSYGEYRQNNNGQSFWHWYGQYSFFNNLVGGAGYRRNPVSYSEWNERPRYSYYNDYGRDNYGSYRDRNKTSQRNKQTRSRGLTPAKPKKQYGSALGRKRASTYSQKAKTQKKSVSKPGPRHADKVARRSSGFLSGAKNRPSSSKPKSKAGYSYGGSVRNSSRRSSGSRRSGGK